MAYDKQKVLTKAAAYARKGKLDRAIEAYREVIANQPEEMRAHLKIGDLLARQDNPEDAAVCYLRVADHYADGGFARKAVAVYRRVIELQPKRVEVSLQLAGALQELGLQADVRAVLVAAIGELDGATSLDALATLEAMAALDPTNVPVQVRLAELRVERNLQAEALAALQRLAETLRDSDQLDGFLLVGEKRLVLEPANATLRRELAGVYLRRDQPRRALGLLRDCYDATASDPSTLTLLIKSFLALGHQAEAIVSLKALAEAYDGAGQHSLRDGALQRILRLDPTDSDALAGLGLQARPTAAATPEPVPEPAVEPEPVLEPTPVAVAEPLDLPELSASNATASTAKDSPQPDPVETPRPPSHESGRFGSVDLTGAIDALVTTEKNTAKIAMWLDEARVFVEFGMLEEARRRLDECLESDPHNAEVLAQLAELDAPSEPPTAPSPTPPSVVDAGPNTRATDDLAALLEPNWLEPELVVDLD